MMTEALKTEIQKKLGTQLFNINLISANKKAKKHDHKEKVRERDIFLTKKALHQKDF